MLQQSQPGSSNTLISSEWAWPKVYPLELHAELKFADIHPDKNGDKT